MSNAEPTKEKRKNRHPLPQKRDMEPTNKLRAISEQALKNLTTRRTRLVPIERRLPDPQMLKDFLQLDLPLGDPRTRRLEHAADI